VAEGDTGVGDEQAKACRACKNFGAAISAVPGKLGNVYPDLCFDASCNAKKVAARIKLEKDKATPAEGSSKDVIRQVGIDSQVIRQGRCQSRMPRSRTRNGSRTTGWKSGARRCVGS
jgi:hypothetical protein